MNGKISLRNCVERLAGRAKAAAFNVRGGTIGRAAKRTGVGSGGAGIVVGCVWSGAVGWKRRSFEDGCWPCSRGSGRGGD